MTEVTTKYTEKKQCVRLQFGKFLNIFAASVGLLLGFNVKFFFSFSQLDYSRL